MTGYFLIILELLDLAFRFSTVIIIIGFIIITCKIINKSGHELISNYTNILVIGAVTVLLTSLSVTVCCSNITRNGLKTESDYIEIAKFLKLDYDKVYAYYLPDYNFFTQVISDYIKIDELKEIEIDTSDEDVAIIVYTEFDGKIYGAEKANIDTKYFDVYVNDEESTSIKIVPNN